ncbi:hypothetical protein [Texcoconibacillus texcoconensis]|uniref:Membrane protein DedA with SNARE-associated domain n=1 Tax=Texcoconibacillus texcoconensis TaxID=1095777 RepID=A0A840QMZ7_9BACI|nr:hypothetical protein [Texcoconibacillus texcoconensis]MBB5172737.1 membrane protein DedA with SNARE-associated domain [Texcoconibacillus texcoconensis]
MLKGQRYFVCLLAVGALIYQAFQSFSFPSNNLLFYLFIILWGIISLFALVGNFQAWMKSKKTTKKSAEDV